MEAIENILSRYAKLISDARGILAKYEYNGEYLTRDQFPSPLKYNKWYASAKHLVSISCGIKSVHYQQLEAIYQENLKSSYNMPACLGVLEAAYEDIKAGLLQNYRILITAEVFVDFINQAEYLLAENYKLPAAVLAGAVLEDALRTLCIDNGISLSDKPKLDWMNSELAKKKIYNKNVHKQITAWAGIRNSAAHGKPDEFNEIDVKNMISGIINFNSNFLR